MLSLHHITVYARSVERSKKFYTKLGLRCRETTVGQHDPNLVQVNFEGDSGAYLSLLFYPRCQKGKVGLGGVSRITLATTAPIKKKLVKDPDGLEWELIPNQSEVRIIGVTSLRKEELIIDDEVVPLTLEDPDTDEFTKLGYGIVHHVALQSDGATRRYIYDTYDQLWELRA